MQKEELLHVHMLMLHIKKYSERVMNGEIETDRYKSLEITPLHIFRTKNAHRDAILTLGNEIVTHIHHHLPHEEDRSSEPAPGNSAAEQ